MSAQIIPDSPNRQTVTDRILTDDRVETRGAEMERESLRGLWKRCITCVFVQNFGFVSQPTVALFSHSVATDSIFGI